MNKQVLDKLNLLLTGLTQRIRENRLYIISMEACFKSGTVEQKASILFEGDKIKMHFCGNTETMEIDWLPLRIAYHGAKFDSMVFSYHERGTSIVIEADQKNVKMYTKEQNVQGEAQNYHEISVLSGRDYLIKVGKADPLLREIGILGQNGKLKNDMIRKYNQIDHFVELILPMIEKICGENAVVNIMDCGCGKSYLTFVLNYYIRDVLKKDCFFIGLDRSEGVVAASTQMAKHLGYHNMFFQKSNIIDYQKDRKIHLLISLHACDTATDEALAVGINNQIPSMVVVPCCHSELHGQYNFMPFQHILKHGVLKARMADILTDGLRSLFLEALGYKVSMIEYISPLETPKNLMMRIEKTQGFSTQLKSDYDVLKSTLGVRLSLEKFVQNSEEYKN